MSKDAPPEELQSDFPPLDLSPLVEEAQEETREEAQEETREEAEEKAAEARNAKDACQVRNAKGGTGTAHGVDAGGTSAEVGGTFTDAGGTFAKLFDCVLVGRQADDGAAAAAGFDADLVEVLLEIAEHPASHPVLSRPLSSSPLPSMLSRSEGRAC